MRNRLLLVLALACMAFVLNHSTSFAAKPEGCNFIGTWYGYGDNNVYWVSTANGQNASSGTYVLEVPGFLNTLPGAVRATAARGAWERVDEFTFAATVVAIAVDLSGQALYLVKVSGVDTLSEDCNTMSITNTIELFYGYQDPFKDDPFYVIFPNPHTGFRMHVDPPVTP